MCYSTRATRKKEELEERLRVKAIVGEMDPDEELIYNHANGWGHPQMWILPQQQKGYMIHAMWGLMPTNSEGLKYKQYFTDNRGAFGGLNSRSDNLFSIALYRDSIVSRRCVIPVDGFFEPHTTPTKKSGKPYKVPFYFSKKDGGTVNLAGIYNQTKDGLITFSVITREATPLFEEIHNQPSNKHGDYRRPVVLDDYEIDYWLEEGHDSDDIYDIIDNDLPDYEFNAWPISKDLNKRKGEDDRPDLIDVVHHTEIEIDYEGKPTQPDLFG